MAPDPESLPEGDRPSGPAIGAGCLIVVGIVIAGTIAGYVVGLFTADSDGLEAMTPAMIGTIAGAVLGAIVAAVLLFRQR